MTKDQTCSSWGTQAWQEETTTGT